MEAKCKILLGGFAGGLLGVTVAFGAAILMGALRVYPFVSAGGGANIGAGMAFMALLMGLTRNQGPHHLRCLSRRSSRGDYQEPKASLFPVG